MCLHIVCGLYVTRSSFNNITSHYTTPKYLDLEESILETTLLPFEIKCNVAPKTDVVKDTISLVYWYIRLANKMLHVHIQAHLKAMAK